MDKQNISEYEKRTGNPWNQSSDRLAVINLIKTQRICSVSKIQRNARVGLHRALAIISELQHEGIIGEYNLSLKGYEIIVKIEDLE